MNRNWWYDVMSTKGDLPTGGALLIILGLCLFSFALDWMHRHASLVKFLCNKKKRKRLLMAGMLCILGYFIRQLVCMLIKEKNFRGHFWNHSFQNWGQRLLCIGPNREIQFPSGRSPIGPYLNGPYTKGPNRGFGPIQ